MFDTIHEALKMDESKGVIVGGSLVGAAVLGSAAKGAVLEGDPSARLQAEGFISGTEGENLPGQMETGQEGTAAVCADMDSLTSAVPEFSGDFLKMLSEVSSWDEFLALFPKDTVDHAGEPKEYLQQLLSGLIQGISYGRRSFPEMPELHLRCMGTFYVMYFYLNEMKRRRASRMKRKKQNFLRNGKVELPRGSGQRQGQIKPLSGETRKIVRAAGDPAETQRHRADSSKVWQCGGHEVPAGGGPQTREAERRLHRFFCRITILPSRGSVLRTRIWAASEA